MYSTLKPNIIALTAIIALASGNTYAKNQDKSGIALADAPQTLIASKFQRHINKQAFTDAKKCLEASIHTEQYYNEATVCKSLQSSNAEAFKACSQRLPSLNAKIQQNENSLDTESCSKDPAILQSNFKNSVIKSANEGDADAQVCYVQGWFSLSAEELEQYKHNAVRYIELGLSRGDWRVVQLMTTTPEDIAHGGAGLMVNIPAIGSPLTIYRAYALLSLGSTGEYAKHVGMQKQDAIMHLTDEQVNRANAWALREYTNSFNRSPKLAKAPTPCIYTTP